MLEPGLVSITFRSLTCKEIAALVKKAGLSSIEWGGDVHVPQGDIKKARETRKMTEDAGLSTAAYGSYYRTGCELVKTGEKADFQKTLETALELNAPVIRVWAGDRGSAEADSAWREKIIEESRKISDEAEKEGITIAFEFHGGTLTDTNESALELIEGINRENVKTYWQPSVGSSMDYRLQGLRMLLPRLSHIHAFHWEGRERRPFSEGKEEWKKYISLIEQAKGDRHIMLEFVKDESPEQFLRDAEVLKKLTA